MAKSKKFCQICKTVGGTYWNHNTTECGRIKYLKKLSGSHKSYRSSKNYDSKKLNALILEQVIRALRNSKKYSKSSKKGHSENSSDLDGSDSGEE